MSLISIIKLQSYNQMIKDKASIQKVQTIIKNVEKLPPNIRNHVSLWLKAYSTEKQQADQIQNIRIQTFYRLTQSTLYSLHWEQPNEEVKYPITAVIVDKYEQAQAYLLGIKISTWIESGGTRIIPIKANASEADLQKTIRITHCAIFVSTQNDSQQYQNFVRCYVKKVMQQAKYPLLFLGKSCSAILSEITSVKLNVCKLSMTKTNLFISYDSQLFKGLDLGLRIEIQNRNCIGFPAVKLKVDDISIQTLQPSAFMKCNQQALIFSMEDKQRHIYILLNELTFQNLQSIQLWHNAILNFIDITKASKRQVDQKKVQKKLLAYCKIIHRADKTYYRIQ